MTIINSCINCFRIILGLAYVLATLWLLLLALGLKDSNGRTPRDVFFDSTIFNKDSQLVLWTVLSVMLLGVVAVVVENQIIISIIAICFFGSSLHAYYSGLLISGSVHLLFALLSVFSVYLMKQRKIFEDCESMTSS